MSDNFGNKNQVVSLERCAITQLYWFLKLRSLIFNLVAWGVYMFSPLDVIWRFKMVSLIMLRSMAQELLKLTWCRSVACTTIKRLIRSNTWSLQMIFPWMFEEIFALRPFRDAANVLAEKTDWPPLYDIASLNTNKVRGAGFCWSFYFLNLVGLIIYRRNVTVFYSLYNCAFSREKLSIGVYHCAKIHESIALFFIFFKQLIPIGLILCAHNSSTRVLFSGLLIVFLQKTARYLLQPLCITRICT